MIRTSFVLWVLAALAACGPGAKGGPSMNNTMSAPEAQPQVSPVVSADILAREAVTNNASIKHILVGWAETGSDNARDQRAVKRTKPQAEDEVREILKQIQGGADFDALMKQYSEDPGSAQSARAYPVSPDASLVIEFKQLGLRLKVGEIGVVQSEYGFHIMKRVE